jgi:hypothetical protein
MKSQSINEACLDLRTFWSGDQEKFRLNVLGRFAGRLLVFYEMLKLIALRVT